MEEAPGAPMSNLRGTPSAPQSQERPLRRKEARVDPGLGPQDPAYQAGGAHNPIG